MEKSHKDFLLRGVDYIDKWQTPAAVQATSGKAFKLLATKDYYSPWAAATYGNGRIVGFGHNSYFGIKHDVSQSIKNAMKNSIAWLHSSNMGAQSLRLGGIGLTKETIKQFMDVVARETPNLRYTIDRVVDKCTEVNVRHVVDGNPDIIFWTNSDCNLEKSSVYQMDVRAEMMLQYVNQGGGVFLAWCSWGWRSICDIPLNECVLNDFASRAGLFFSNDYAWGDEDGKYYVSSPHLRGFVDIADNVYSHIDKALTAIQFQDKVEYGVIHKAVRALQTVPQTTLVPAKSPRISGFLPVNDQDLRNELQNLKRLLEDRCMMMPDPDEIKFRDGIASSQVGAFFVYAEYLKNLMPRVPVSQCPRVIPHTQFPNNPSSLYNPRRLTGGYLFTLNPYLEGWQTTAVYAPPGEVLRLTVSDQVMHGHKDIRFNIQMGCHTDWLKTMQDDDKNYNLRRHPAITANRHWTPRQFGDPDNLPFHWDSAPATTNTLTIVSPFGGLVYIELVSGFTKHGPPLTVEIQGGVLVPYYNIQKELREIPWSPVVDSYPHGRIQWSQRVLEYGDAPWGEIEGRYIVISAPIEALRGLSDPYPVVDFYDKVVAHYLALSGQELKRKERIVGDIHISGGSLHSGYPIMGYGSDLYAKTSNGMAAIFDVQSLHTEGNWGLFHELGHNRQKGEWTFSGTTELNNRSPYSAKYYTENCKNQAIEYLQDHSKTFDNTWIDDCNVALATYVPLIEEFGWQFMSDVFRSYLAGSFDLPDDPSKHTQWVLQTSKVAQVDLRPYFSQWKWSFDNHKLRELDRLPTWDKDVVQVLSSH